MPCSLLSTPRRACLLALAFCLPCLPAHAAPSPVSVKDLCLMLRSGYTSDEVLRETAARPLLEPIGPDAEKALLAAGGDARFINSLKTAHPTLSDDEASAARAHQRLLDLRNDATRQLQASRLQPVAAPVAAAGAQPAARGTDPHYIEDMLRGKLVSFRDEQFQPLGSNAMESKKLYGVYYSAYVSKEGHLFSPELVKFYRAAVASHPEFEIVLVSEDRNTFAMQNMMHDFQMPWPALAFDQIPQVPLLQRFIDPSKASRLIVVTGYGRMLADYRLAVGNPNLLMYLPDLQKLLDNPAKPSTVAPPDMRPVDPTPQ